MPAFANTLTLAAIPLSETFNIVVKHSWIICLLFIATNSTAQSCAHLIKQLDTIHNDDQIGRSQLQLVQEKFGGQSTEMNLLLSMIRRKDSVNQLKVGSILDKYGWLGTAEIGTQGNQTLFLVIQHAEKPVQEKYFELMKKAVESGKLKASSFALLEDRLALKQGKYQIYGSQIRWDMSSNSYQVMPIRDPEHVDIRRANVGLPPISVYLLELGIEWDMVKYKMYVSKLALELGLKNE